MDRWIVLVLGITSVILGVIITRFNSQHQNEVMDQFKKNLERTDNHQTRILQELQKLSTENIQIQNQLLESEAKFGALAQTFETSQTVFQEPTFENITFIYTITNFTTAIASDLVGKELFLDTSHPTGFRLRWKIYATIRYNQVSLAVGLVGSNQPFVYAKKTCLLLNADQQVHKTYSRHFNSIDRHSVEPAAFWVWPNFVAVDLVGHPKSGLLSPRDDALHILVNLEIYGRGHHLYDQDETCAGDFTSPKDVFAFQQIVTSPNQFLASIEGGKTAVIKDGVELGGKWGAVASSKWKIALSTEKDNGDLMVTYHVIPQQLPKCRNLYGVYSFAISFRNGPTLELGNKATYDFKTKEYENGLHGGTGVTLAVLEESFKWYKTATIDLSLTIYGRRAKFYEDIE